MTLKIYRHELGGDLNADFEQKPIQVNRSEDTYLTLLEKVFGLFEITESLEQYRLRAYNPQHKIMTETYTGREDHLLPDLAIHSFKTLILEQKETSAVFEEYDPTVMTVKINIWR